MQGEVKALSLEALHAGRDWGGGLIPMGVRWRGESESDKSELSPWEAAGHERAEGRQ